MPKIFNDNARVVRLTPAEYAAIPVGRPPMVSEQPVGTAWIEGSYGGVRIRQIILIGPDGPIIDTIRPVIRVKAISRLVPRRLEACS